MLTLGRDYEDLMELWQFGPLGPLLQLGAHGGAAVDLATGTVHLEAAVRVDTLPAPLDPGLDDAGLRAALLARAEDAIAVLEAAGWVLPAPVIRLQAGATWHDPADPGGDPIVGEGSARVACWLVTTLTRRPDAG